MLWNEVGRQTKRVVICPHCVAIDLLLYAAGFLEGTASTKKKAKKKKACMLHQKIGSPGQTSQEAQLPSFASITGWINDRLITEAVTLIERVSLAAVASARYDIHNWNIYYISLT